jgi:hypothetical protein
LSETVERLLLERLLLERLLLERLLLLPPPLVLFSSST